MPTPAFPSGFKPAVAGYRVGAPAGVAMTEVGGGLPRVAMEWDRGRQRFSVTLIVSEFKYGIWAIFFHKTIRNGAVQFTMPINSGHGLQQHVCLMVPDSYSAVPVGSTKTWSISFDVLAESKVHEMSQTDAADILGLWESYGEGLADILPRLDQFATVDTLVLAPTEE